MEKKIRKAWFGGLYSVTLLRRDFAAGVTVAAVAVPQAMAYALIAGIQPEYGLYTAIVPTVLASVFGSSAHLINGPTNAISLVVFSAVAGLTPGGDAPHRIVAVCVLAVLVGLIQVLIALLKLGDLTRYVSESVLLGFMAGAGLLVALGQIPNFLGLERPEHVSSHPLLRLGQILSRGHANLFAFGVGAITVAMIVAVRRFSAWVTIEIPDLLISLVLVSAAVWFLGWAQPTGSVEVIDPISGRFSLTDFHLLKPEWIPPLAGSALAIALLGLLESLAIAKSIAARTRQPLDFNRQCLAEGLANIGGGLFQCMPGSGSLTRSSINFHAGAATRLSGVIGAVAVAGMLWIFAPLAQDVPKPALAGILMVSAWRLVDRRRLRYALRATRFDAIIALATLAVALFISIEFSILIGTFLSFLFFVPRAARLQAHELVLSPERVVRERQPNDPQCTKMALFSLEGELFFGAAPELDDHLAELKRRVSQGVRIVVLRLKRARNPDMVCLERLQRFLEDMKGQSVTVLFCGVRADFAAALDNVRFHRWLPPPCLFLEDATTGSSTLQAVRHAYELLGNDRCATCPRLQETGEDKGGWYYMI